MTDKANDAQSGRISKPVRFYVRKFWRPFALGTLTLALTNLFDILTPFALMKAIDAITGGDRGKLIDSIWLYIAFMIGAVSFRHQWRTHFGRFHHSVADDIRMRLFHKYSDLGPSFFEKNPTGELMSLMINDVNTFRMAVGPGLLILIDAFFLILFIVPFMISISLEWTWKTMILLPLLPFVIRFMENRIGEASRNSQDRLAEMSGYVQELVSGIRVIKGYAQESNRQKVFRTFSDKYSNSCNLVSKYDSFFEPVLQVGVASGSVILLAWGSNDVLAGAVTIGTFVAFHEYIKRMIWPMAAIGSGLSLLQQGRSSFERINTVLETLPDVIDSGKQKINRFEKLEICDLTFTYPGATHPALNAISLKLKRGEVLGIVGPVGSGKSTLVQLLGRIRPAPAKTIFVNGEPIENFLTEAWRSRLAVAPQDAFLFSRTVEENILFGKSSLDNIESSLDPEAILHADSVALREEIERLPLGFRAWLGEKGVNLSGGQRQRMTIARALAHAGSSEVRTDRQADIVVLDDSLSAVDGKTEEKILAALRANQNSGKDTGFTSIIISHRLAAVAHSDRILVLNEGRIEAVGTTHELMTTSPTFRRMHELQETQKHELEEATT